jgi:AraC-like DNA-binding protein
VESGILLRTEAALAGCDLEPRPVGNRALRGPGYGAPADALRGQVEKALGSGSLLPEARQALEFDLAYLAARLRSWGAAHARPDSSSRRRLAVRRVEEFLSAHPRALPSVAELCALAGVGERTLEYAFREQIGVPPARYLRMRRLNGVRRELRSGDPATLRVTEVAMRWGFWELGRFAGEYRALFGERPSATLAARAVARSRSPRA